MCVVHINKQTAAQHCQGVESVLSVLKKWLARSLHWTKMPLRTHTQIEKTHFFYTEERSRSRTPKSHIQRQAQCAKWCAFACSRTTLESSQYRYSTTTTTTTATIECSIFKRAPNRYWNSFVCTRKVATTTTTAINSSAQRIWCGRSAAELCVVFLSVLSLFVVKV